MNTENGVNNSGNEQVEDTEAPTLDNTTQEETRTFTQEEVDAIVKGRLEKYKKRYQSVDLEEYNHLKAEKEEREMEAQIKRQEFDKVLTQQKEKYSSEIETLRNELTTLKVDGTLLSAASNRNAVNPEQVAQLLRGSVGLDSQTGQPVVYDRDGSIVYDDDKPMSIEKHVNTFLDSNPHFVKSGPSGVASSGATGPTTREGFDPTKLDMTNPKDRERYKEWRNSQRN